MDIIHRFKAQRISQLIHFKNRKKGKKPARIENCFRLKTQYSHQVTLRKKNKSDKAHYSDLQTCGSVWACPVCSSIISERRKNHLQSAIDIWREKDQCNVVIMITFTTPHYLFQSLADVLKIQDKAIRIMKKQPQRGKYKVWRTIMDELCSIGSFTGREVTFGQNGWHPHRHECHFAVKSSIEDLRLYRSDISKAFAIAFEKAGGVIRDYSAFHNRAVRIDQIIDNDGFDRISSYVTKVEGESWTLAHEATKGMSKLSKNGNITPFGMLDAIRHGDKKSQLYQSKFYEYCQAMHGKKQFFPTNGLNTFLGLQWLSDGDIMNQNDSLCRYAYISDQNWNIILEFGLRGDILELTIGRDEFDFSLELDFFLSQKCINKVA